MLDQLTAEVLRLTREEYQIHAPLWSDYLNWYEGSEISRYLFKHSREYEQDFKDRQRRAAWWNYCAPVIDLYVSYIYKKPIMRVSAREEPEELQPQFTEPPTTPGGEEAGLELPAPEELETGGAEKPSKQEIALARWEKRRKQKLSTEAALINEFWEDVDRTGTPINEYMRDIAILAHIMGHYIVMVDMPAFEAYREMTEAIRIEQKLRPYVVSIDPRNLINWEFDADKRLLWARLKESPPPNPDPFQAVTEAAQEQFLTWTRDAWYRHRILKGAQGDQVELLAAGENPLGEVPLVFVYADVSKKYHFIGKSRLAEIGPLNVSIFNWLSLVDEDVFQKCLSILCMQIAPTDAREEITIGNNNVLTYTGQNPPNFITPSAEPGGFILKLVERAIEEVYRIAKLGGQTGIVRQSKSGVALGYEFSETNQTLSDMADNLEEAETEICRLYMKWLGREFTGYINYPDDFSTESFADELKLATTMKNTVRSKTFKEEVEKQVVRKVMPKLDKNLLNIIDTEIEGSEEEKPSFIPF